jgi:hypothetical protein
MDAGLFPSADLARYSDGNWEIAGQNSDPIYFSDKSTLTTFTSPQEKPTNSDLAVGARD